MGILCHCTKTSYMYFENLLDQLQYTKHNKDQNASNFSILFSSIKWFDKENNDRASFFLSCLYLTSEICLNS